MTNLMIVGYYGASNYGDELMLISLLARDEALKFNSIDILSLGDKAVNIEEISRGRESNWPTIRRTRSIRSDGWMVGRLINFGKLMFEIATVDVIRFGGGTLLFDNVSSSWRNMLGVFKVCLLAKFFGKRYEFVGIGIGEVNSKLGKKICEYCVKGAARCEVRDSESYEKAKNFRPDVVLGEDIAVELIMNEDFSGKNGSSGKVVITLMEYSYRDVGDFDCESMIDALIKALDRYQKEAAFEVLLVPMQNGNLRNDNEVLQILYDKANERGIRMSFLPEADFSEKHDALLSARKIITMRYHPAVVAVSKRSSPLALVITQKLYSFMKESGLENMVIDLRKLNEKAELEKRIFDYLNTR